MKKRKVKRYNGSETSVVEMPEIDEMSASGKRSRDIDEEKGRAIREGVESGRSFGESILRGDAEGMPKRRTFKQAFAEARKGGAKTFEFDGKRYTTEMASEKKRVRSTAPTPDESEAETLRLARQAKMTEPKKSSSGSGAALLAIPALAAAAAGMGRRIKEGSRRTRTEPTLDRPVKLQEIDPFDQMAMDRMTGEGGRKKGGHIKAKKMASGGSASSRGDGIAQRGKTKGRIC